MNKQEESLKLPVVDLDSRTLLPGRDSFYHDIVALKERADTEGKPIILIDIDTKGLDFILRTFGPEERDACIQELGQRIQDSTPTGHLPYHITQDRFAVLLYGDYNYRKTIIQARLLLRHLREPVSVARVLYKLEAYVGISHYPNHAETIAELVRTSVFACHQARDSQRYYATFDSRLDEWERHRFRLMVDLEAYLKQGDGIRMAYQPEVDLKSGQCVAAEGLCRWCHDKLGDIPPGDFLPYVEQTSLMMPFTETTLGLGLTDMTARFNGDDRFTLAINLSPTLLRQADLLERLEEQFRFYSVDPGRVHFEITETGIMAQPKRAVNILKALRQWGCRVAVDDFGTGHSSLAYLADLPIDIIKIDRHFINLLDGSWGEAVVGATATLADKLGLVTVAEGIEDRSQYNKCRDLGVTFGQGFYIGHPMFKDDFNTWADDRHLEYLEYLGSV